MSTDSFVQWYETQRLVAAGMRQAKRDAKKAAREAKRNSRKTQKDLDRAIRVAAQLKKSMDRFLSKKMFFQLGKRASKRLKTPKSSKPVRKVWEGAVKGDTVPHIKKYRLEIYGNENVNSTITTDVDIVRHADGSTYDYGSGSYSVPVETKFDYRMDLQEKGLGAYRTNSYYNYQIVTTYSHPLESYPIIDTQYDALRTGMTDGHLIKISGESNAFAPTADPLNGRIQFGYKPVADLSDEECYDQQRELQGRLNVMLRSYASSFIKVDQDAFADEAWESMRPSLTGSFSLLNFLYEFKDFKGLLKLATQPKAFYKFFKSTKWNLERALQLLSEAHLQWCFAIAPLISDIRQFYNRLINHVEIIRAFCLRGMGDKERGNRRRFIRKYKIADIFPAKISTRLPVTDISRPVQFYWTEIEFRPIEGVKVDGYHSAGCCYTYNCPELKGYWKWMQAKLDLFGINLDASRAWAAIPFSFVVDWFVDVSQFLHARRIDNFKVLNVRLWDFYISRSLKFEELLWIASVTGNRILIRKRNISLYERFQYVPKNYQNLVTSDFSQTKVLLSLSLTKCLSNVSRKFVP